MRSNPKLLLASVIIIVIAVALLSLAVFGGSTRASGLLPILATPTETDNSATASPMSLTFVELNADPLAFLNRAIEVSGTFLPLDTSPCARYTGPAIRWALVSEDLQLDVKGFERVIQLVEPGTEMTVQGVWRLYQGPLGCGKGPPSGSAWYLEAQRIVQPNPLVGTGSGGAFDLESAAPGLPSLLPTATYTATPVPTATVDADVTATAPVNSPLLPSPTADLAVTAATTAAATQFASPTFISSTPPPVETPAGPIATPTFAQTAVAGTVEPGATATPLTPLPPTATQTTGGYPGGSTSTPDPNPYP